MNRKALSIGSGLIALAATSLSLHAADFHVTTAQELQNALTTAAVNGAPDTIWFAAGYFTGNFNYSSTEAADLTLRPEPGVDATQATIDGAGTGRSMNIACTAAANITVTNLTFLRNCGTAANAALRISTMSSISGADVSIGGCRFLGSTNQQGMGIEIASGRNAFIRNCMLNLSGSTSYGSGISVSGVTSEVRVEGNIVTGNDLNSGTGIYVVGSANSFTALIKDNTVSGNRGGSGGVYATLENGGSGRSLTISGNTFTGNGGTYGAIYASAYFSDLVTIIGNTITGNSSSTYAAVYMYAYNSSSMFTLGNNTINGNTGIGVYANRGQSGTFVITNNTVTGNSAGGIHGVGALTITGNTVADNLGTGIKGQAENGTVLSISGNRVLRNQLTSAGNNGAGIYASGPTIKVNNNIVAGNSVAAGSIGGGLYIMPSMRLELLNNTVTGNSGGNGGGTAISISGVTEQLYAYNNIIWGNSATGNGKDVWLAGTGQRKEFLYNNAHDLYGVWDIAENNIDAAPLFYDPLHDDYHLRFGSPGIDAGTNDVALLPTTDVDGDARLINTYPDLGADEFNNLDYHPADLNNDWVISDPEYTAYAAAWKNDQTWTPGPVPVPADFVTRAGYLKVQNSGAYHNAGGPKPVCWKTGAP